MKIETRNSVKDGHGVNSENGRVREEEGKEKERKKVGSRADRRKN